MKTTLVCCPALFLLLSGCGGAPTEGSASGTGTGTDSDTATGAEATAVQVTDPSAPSGVSDSDGDTPTMGGASDSQDVTGPTTTPTTTPTTATDSDTTAGTTVPVDTDADTSTSSPGSDTDTSTTVSESDTSTTASDTTSTTADDTATGDDTTGEPVQCGLELQVTIRDFLVSHPDMEDFCCGQPNGMVQNMLGPTNKPVYANPQGLLSTPENFNQWYTDVPGVNQKTSIVINLTEISPGLFSYSNNAFFPIDNMLWGNEGQPHNYHFTTEIHAQFQYNGGEVFTFRGDDDVWVFINKQLAIDIGGVHGPTEKSVNVDSLGLTLGLTYPLDVFHAERHTVDSNFRIDTTICSTPQ